jgi:hypothetical protein
MRPRRRYYVTAQEHALQLAQTVRDLGRADSGEVDIQHAVEVMLLNVFLEGLFDIPASSVPGGGQWQWGRAVHSHAAQAAPCDMSPTIIHSS